MASLTPEKVITYRVDREGNATITAEGFKGESCVKATQDYEVAAGPQIGPREPTSEMFEQEEQHLEIQSGDDDK